MLGKISFEFSGIISFVFSGKVYSGFCLRWEKCIGKSDFGEKEIWDFVGWEKFMAGKKFRDFVVGGKNAV